MKEKQKFAVDMEPTVKLRENHSIQFNSIQFKKKKGIREIH